jgi:hypothetical protein
MDGIPTEEDAAMDAAGEVTGLVEEGARGVSAPSTTSDTAAPMLRVATTPPGSDHVVTAPRVVAGDP